MPRRDGFPTNNELMAELEIRGRDLYVATFADSFPPLPVAAEDKPAHVLSLDFNLEHDTGGLDGPGLNPVVLEALVLKPIRLDKGTRIAIEQHVQWKGDQEMVERRLRIAEVAGGLLVSNEFDPECLEPQALLTTYVARLRNGRTRFVDTLKDKPTKQTLYSALGLIESITDGDVTVKPKWVIKPTYDMAVSGKEPSAFLHGFFKFLNAEREQYGSFLESSRRSQSRGGYYNSSFMSSRINELEEIVEQIDTNIVRVIQILLSRE
jgi:hypothetical protein